MIAFRMRVGFSRAECEKTCLLRDPSSRRAALPGFLFADRDFFLPSFILSVFMDANVVLPARRTTVENNNKYDRLGRVRTTIS